MDSNARFLHRSLILYLAIKCCLINFESETVLQEGILIYIQPRTIRTGLSFFTIVNNPLIIIVVLWIVHTLYMALDLGKQFIADINITIWRPSYRYFSLTVLHLVLLEFEFLTWSGYSKILESHCIIRLSDFLCILRLHLEEDFYVADIYQHVRFEHSLSRIHFLKNSETYLKVPD